MGTSASQPHGSAGLELRKHAIHAADKPPATITMAAMNHGSVLPGNTRSGRSPFSPITASLPTPSLAARGAGECLEPVADHLAPRSMGLL